MGFFLTKILQFNNFNLTKVKKIILMATIVATLPMFLTAQNQYSYRVELPRDFRAIDKNIIISVEKQTFKNYMAAFAVKGKHSEKTKIVSNNNIVRYTNVVITDINNNTPFDTQAAFSEKSVMFSFFFFEDSKKDTLRINDFCDNYMRNIIANIEKSRSDAFIGQYKTIEKEINKSEKKVVKALNQKSEAQLDIFEAERTIEIESKKIEENKSKLEQKKINIQESTKKIKAI